MEFMKNMCIPIEIREIILFLIMYADRTVLFSETEQYLQDIPNCLYQYTTKKNITVNVDKIKVVVFRKSGRIKQNLCWKYDNEIIDIVDKFNYLGVTFSTAILELQCKKVKVVYYM
jgi:hypothetical protein